MKVRDIASLFAVGVPLALVSIFAMTNAAFSAPLHTPITPSWGRPADSSAASASLSTYQEWDSMVPTAAVPAPGSPLDAQIVVNPNATLSVQPYWFDSSAPGDGAFQAGTDAYSFGGVITPVVVSPGYDVPGNQLDVSVEAQSFGSLIDTSDLTATYTDPGGTVRTILVSGLPSFQYSQAYNDGGSDFGGFGTAYTVDNLWTFTLPQDTASLQLSWGWGVTSSALQAVSVDTRSVAAPEPASAAMAAVGGIGLLIVWSGRCRSRRPGESLSRKTE